MANLFPFQGMRIVGETDNAAVKKSTIIVTSKSILLLSLFSLYVDIKGIFQPFELGGVTRLVRSAVKFWKAGN
jgi:hypothetical protein